MNENYCRIWLSSVPGLGSRRCIRMAEAAPEGRSAGIYTMTEKEITETAIRAEKSEERGMNVAGMIIRGRKTASERANAACAAMDKSGMRFVCIEDREFPDRLRKIPDPPYGLYYLGRCPSDNEPSVAVIGARSCTAYGLHEARRFSQAFAAAGVTVISGMARGIDSAAQTAAVEMGARSIAVLGSGADVCYPKSERALYENLIAHGTVLSEYPPGTGPDRTNFPARNRIISGLCDKLLVVEARKKSGTMITVSAALEQSRDVWAVPGRCTDVNSEGCNQMIFDGAGIALSPEFMIESFFTAGHIRNMAGEEDSRVQAAKEARMGVLKSRIPESEGREVYLRLCSLLNEWEEKSTEQLCQEMNLKYHTELDAGEAAFRLMRLTVLGLCRETASGRYTGT